MSQKFLVPIQLPADPANPLEAATKQYVDAGDATKGPLRQTISTTAVTSYTLALADENTLKVFTAATAIALTVPTNATVALPVGARIDIAQTGAGKITVGGAGVTITGTPSLVLRAAGSAASLIQIAANSWLLVGDLT